MLNFWKKLLFQGNLCYHGVDYRIRLQEQKPSEIFSGPKGPKNQFLAAVAEPAA
jgi:hypothetical protein